MLTYIGPEIDADSSWVELIQRILSYGTEAAPRGKSTKELVCSHTRVPMRFPVLTDSARQLGLRFATTEAWWIMSGKSSLADLGKFARYLAPFSDDGVRLQGAYGPMFVEQVRYVIDSLLEDTDSRQAVASFWRPNPRPSRDCPCTVSLQWLLRKSRLDGYVLHCVATMRSSDAWLGWPYDVFSFSMLSAYVGIELSSRLSAAHGRSDGESSVELGILYLTAGSQHLYVDAFESYPGLNEVVGKTAGVRDGSTRPYEPLDLKKFSRGADLQEHLRKIGTGEETRSEFWWMRDLLQ